MPAAGLAALAAALDAAGGALAQAIEVLRHVTPPEELAEHGVPDAADLPVGIADRALLAACERLLGRPAERSVRCGTCGEWTTFVLRPDDVPPHWPVNAWIGHGCGVREPSYADVLAAGGSAEALLARCAHGTGAALEDLARIEGSLSGPLRSACVECGALLVVDADVLSLAIAALGEVRAAVDRETHLLAAAYGWDPAVIDALPDERRHRLAELVAGGAA